LGITWIDVRRHINPYSQVHTIPAPWSGPVLRHEKSLFFFTSKSTGIVFLSAIALKRIDIKVQ
jgi:hypothetical protein